MGRRSKRKAQAYKMNIQLQNQNMSNQWLKECCSDIQHSVDRLKKDKKQLVSALSQLLYDYDYNILHTCHDHPCFRCMKNEEIQKQAFNILETMKKS